MIELILTAVITFVATSIDEIPVLFLLYKKASNLGKGKTITANYYMGTFLLVAVSLVAAMGLMQIPVKWALGFIGLFPVIMGIKIICRGDDDDEKAEALAGKGKTLWLQVLIITLALGADDLGVYIPLFTTWNSMEVLLMLLVFTVGVAVLCLVSYKMTHIEKLTVFIEKQERYIIGIVFVILGIVVMYKCGTVPGIMGLFSR